MCCFTTIFLVIGSRLAILVWWLVDPQRFSQAADSLGLSGLVASPAWVWTLVGGIFLPWTTLAYVLVFPGGVVGYEWAVLIVGILIDLAGHSGGWRHRHHITRYARRRAEV